MSTFLTLWAAAGACVMAYELVYIWRSGSDFATVCRTTRADARLAGNPVMGAVLGSRIAVALIVLAIWPVPLLFRLRGGQR
jgi:hypothetical protein